MSVQFYDKALVKKLRNWTGKTDIQIYGPDETRRLFETIADKTGDKPIQLPIICLRRKGGFTIENPNKKPLTFDGMRLDANEESAVKLNAIPVVIPYQLDVYTRYMEEADAYIRNLIFNIINYPTLQVVVPYDDTEFTHNANIRVSPDVEDNSDIQEIAFRTGQFTRMSLTIDIDDAYLWDVRIRSNVSIDADGLCVEIAKTPEDDTDFIVEYVN